MCVVMNIHQQSACSGLIKIDSQFDKYRGCDFVSKHIGKEEKYSRTSL